ncbi:MAG: DUF3084 domain-containing protein [Armatimonadetes bacterium]|nr:DUF3084 domain-containing protein [Armatimonadota bacterium]
MGTALVLLFFLAVCGLIAYLGDLIGRRLGKRRLSLFGLRPRHTAVLVTIITGVLIAGVSLASAFGVSRNVRIAVLHGERLLQQQGQLEARVQVESERLARAQRLNQDLEATNHHLQEQNRRLQESNAGLTARNQRLEGRNRNLLARNQNLQGRNTHLAASNARLTRTLTRQQRAYQTLHHNYGSLRNKQEGLQNAFSRTRGDLDRAQKDLQTAEGNLQRARAELARAQAEVHRLQVEAQSLNGQLDALQQTNTRLKGANDTLGQQTQVLQRQAEEVTKRLREEEEKAREAGERVVRAQNRLATLQWEVERLEGRIEPYEKRDLIYTAGQEVARRPLPAGAPPEIIRNALQYLLYEVRVNAERRGARANRPGGSPVFLDEVRVLDEASGEGRVLSAEGEILAHLEMGTLRDGGALLFRALASRNVPAGTPVPLYITATPMRLAVRRGEEVAATTLDSRESRKDLWAYLLRFLQVDVRREMVEHLGIEPGEQWELAHVEWDNLSDVIRKVKSCRGLARVRAIARYDTWTSGPLDLDLQVESLRSKM